MKRYFYLIPLFTLWDIIVKSLLRTEEFAESIEVGFLCLKNSSNPSLGHRFFALTLILTVALVAENYEAKSKVLMNTIVPRFCFSRKKKIIFYTSSIIKYVFTVAFAKLTSDYLLCIIFNKYDDLFTITKLNILFCLFVMEFFLLSGILCIYGIKQSTSMFCFLFSSIFIPDISIKNNLLCSMFVIATTTYTESFFAEIVIKLITIFIIYIIYLRKLLKTEFINGGYIYD